MLDFSRFEVLTFDCYGTLIDWETGLLAALHPIVAAHGKHADDARLLQLYGELEPQIEAGPYRRYRAVLREVVRQVGARLGFEATDAEMDSLPDSLGSWPPFPDTVAALRRLKSRYALAIISNTDDDLFAATARLLELPFDHVITAQQVGSYKPSLANFRHALEVIDRPKGAVLHCAESRFHDIAPARELGLATVWVNRHAARPGPSASGGGSAVPDLEVPDMKTLADQAGV